MPECDENGQFVEVATKPTPEATKAPKTTKAPKPAETPEPTPKPCSNEEAEGKHHFFIFFMYVFSIKNKWLQ